MKLAIRSAVLIFLAALCWAAGPSAAPTEALYQTAGGVASGAKLPSVFATVLPDVKAKSQIPILLPDNLPLVIRKAKNAVLDKASASEYAISLWYELGAGDSGFAASFSAKRAPGYSPDELSNVQPLRLAHRLRGFFRPVSCGGSCAPASLSWKEQGIVYEVQLKLPSTMPEQRQRAVIMTTANSAILAGPR